MSEELTVDAPERCTDCPIDTSDCPAVMVAWTGSRAVLCEQDNVDGWLASTVVVDLNAMR
ncbi:hypothetical protein [Natronorarus salvus]|uniref:hypothetical protein n=1 Tax=Natronorarus salvus TaxID=3117733 RepID=UPI002F2650DB